MATKHTEIGPLPADWCLVSLGEVVQSVEYGSSAPSKPRGAVPVLRMGNLQGGRIDWSDLVYSDDPREIERYALAARDVLFNRTNTVELVGKTSIYEGGRQAIFAGYLIRVVPRTDRLDARYLNYIMNTELARKHSAKVLSVAVSQANINAEKLKTYPIPLPPTVDEQRAIAAALGDVDALIDALDRLIAKKRDLKQAAMQQLLTGKTRLPGFKVDWTLTKLGALGTWCSGGTPSKKLEELWAGPIPWVSPKDMKVLRLRDAQDHVAEAALGRGTRLLPAGALLIVVRGMILAHSAPVARAEVPLAFNQDIKGLVVRDGVDSVFLLWWLAANESLLLSKTNDSTHGTKRIPSEGLFEIRVDLPELDEQHAIAEVLSDMDAELTALEQRREKTRLIKQGMMQELLTGRTRLV